MTPDTIDLSPEEAWMPLSKFDWNPQNVLHFLRRSGFSSTPQAVRSATDSGLKEAVHSRFGEPRPMPEPDSFEGLRTEIRDLRKEINALPRETHFEERRTLQAQIRKAEQDALNELIMDWLVFASEETHSAQEKFVLFLQDVFVVDRLKIRQPELLYDHQSRLRQGMAQTYPELCKEMVRSRALARYLDLDRSTEKKPNENFARELFELFTLGEGNYTEQDIKEAARALTGYRPSRSDIAFNGKYHDDSPKTIFGETGNWDGDDVVDLIFKQPAARTFLIKEMVRYYLGDQLPPDAVVATLGDQWAANDFSLPWLIDTFFQSRLFYHPQYQGNLIKSPMQFYLGLCQDLSIDVVPFPRHTLLALRGMGQDPFNPPNVRGWQYGAYWINSSTVTARRATVEFVFEPINTKKLNGDEQKALSEAREAGRGTLTVSTEKLEKLLVTENLPQHALTYLFVDRTPETFRTKVTKALKTAQNEGDPESLRACLIALLQSPAYNLC